MDRLHDAHLSSRDIVEKQGAAVAQHLMRVPFENSNCQFVLRNGGFFTAQQGDD